MARIAGVNIPQNKLVHVGLTYIYGIGDQFSNQICSALEIKKSIARNWTGLFHATGSIFLSGIYIYLNSSYNRYTLGSAWRFIHFS